MPILRHATADDSVSVSEERERERKRNLAKSEAPLRNHRYASFTRASPRGTRSNRSPFDPMPLCRSIRAIQIAFLETIDVTTINPSRNETGGYTQGLLVSRAPRKSKIRPSPLPRQPRLESDDKRRSRPVEKYRSLLPTKRDPRSFPSPCSGRARLLQAPVQSSLTCAQVRARRLPSEKSCFLEAQTNLLCHRTSVELPSTL